MAVERTLYKGKKELSMAEYEALAAIDPNIDYDILDYPTGGITNTQMQFALSCKRLFPVGTVLTCIDDGTYKNNYTYKIIVNELGIKAWEEVTIIVDQDYAIVNEEPIDKSEGKMIYLKSEVPLGKATINKTMSGYYSKPDDVFSKISLGTATATDLENYEYILINEGGYLLGYINLGDLTALAEYMGSTLTLYYKINNGEEQSETLTKNEDGWFVGNNLTIFTTSNLGVSVPTNYFSATIQNDMAFAVATTDTIEITRLNINGTFITPGQIADSFNINNLKIADGEKYTALNDILRPEIDLSQYALKSELPTVIDISGGV